MKKQKKGKRRPPASRKKRKSTLSPSRPAAVMPSDGDVSPSMTSLGLVVSQLQAGQPAEALSVCQRVLAVEPDNAEALNLAGVSLFQMGDGRQALSMLDTAVAFQPDHTDANNNRGNVLRAMGRLDEAEAAYGAVLAADPNHVDGNFNFGIVLEAQGRFAEAEATYRRCISARTGFAAGHFNLANVLRALGRLDEAVVAYGRAIDLDPLLAPAHGNLGTVHQELGRLAEAEACFRKATGLAPEFAEAHYNLGIILQETGKFDDALIAYGKALDAAPDHVGAVLNTGYAQKELGRFDQAEAAYRKAMDMAPDYDKSAVNLGDLLVESGDAAGAIAVCDGFLNGHAGNTSVLAFKAIALAELGDEPGTRELLDFDRLIAPQEVPPPTGYKNIGEFNDALADHVLGHPSLSFAPSSHATRNGRHSGELLSEPLGPMVDFEQAVRNAAEAYREDHPPDPTHPFLAQGPDHVGLSAWGVVMVEGGHQIAHIHPAAWLSGVYYPQLPGVVRDDDPDHAGWIEFGRPPDDFHWDKEPPMQLIRPEEGLMILFPSYMYHRTVPFQSDSPRISIAFDILPLQG